MLGGQCCTGPLLVLWRTLLRRDGWSPCDSRERFPASNSHFRKGLGAKRCPFFFQGPTFQSLCTAACPGVIGLVFVC